MKTMKKALLFMLCAALVVSATVFGTLAYLTDTEAVTNTFTVGQIAISLDEADVKPDGTPDTDSRVQANEYHLLPGCTYSKDPIVHVDSNSEDSYIFIKVVNGISAIEASDYTKVADQITVNDWKVLEGEPGVYWQEFDKDADPNDYELEVFQNFKIEGTVDNATLAGYATKDNDAAKITVTAYAIQKTGFASPAEAWAAGNKPADQGGWLENQPQNP